MVMTVNFLVMSTALDQETRAIMLMAVAYGGVIQATLVYYVTNVSLSTLRVDSKHSQIWYSVLLFFLFHEITSYRSKTIIYRAGVLD